MLLVLFFSTVKQQSSRVQTGTGSKGQNNAATNTEDSLHQYLYHTGFVALCEEQHEHAQEPHSIQIGRDGGVPFRAEALLRGEQIKIFVFVGFSEMLRWHMLPFYMSTASGMVCFIVRELIIYRYLDNDTVVNTELQLEFASTCSLFQRTHQRVGMLFVV